MGSTAVCYASLGSQRGEVQATLEGAGIRLRGDFRADLAAATLHDLKVEGAALCAATAQGPLALELGADEATRWLNKLLHPPSLLDKLGVRPGTSVYVERRHEVVLAALAASGAAQVAATEAKLIFLVVESARDLSRIATLARGRAQGAQLWILRRKGKAAVVRESSIMDAARAAGLAPSKTAAWSDEWAADRYGAAAKPPGAKARSANP